MDSQKTVVARMAEKYYPNLWSKDRLKALVEADKLTKAKYKSITGEVYANE